MGETNLKQVNIKLDKIESDILAIEGLTSQYSKAGTAIAEIGVTGYWALELNTDFAPPETTEIEPGIYNVWRIRPGVADLNVTPIDRTAYESVGTIYGSQVFDDITWNVGDLAKVVFSGGYVRTDQDPTETIKANITGGVTDTVTVLDSDLYLVGWLIEVNANKGTKNVTQSAPSTTVIADASITEAINYWKDGEVIVTSGTYVGQSRQILSSAVGSITVSSAFPGSIIATTTLQISSPREYRTITVINDGIHLTVGSVFNNDYTTALGATVNRAIKQDLTTAVLFTTIYGNEVVDVPFSIPVTNIEADILDLSAADSMYSLRDLVVKSVDPGAGETITITLYKLVNDIATAIDDFIINSANFTYYYHLMDMFGEPYLIGSDIRITAVSSDAGPHNFLTGQYSYAKTDI